MLGEHRRSVWVALGLLLAAVLILFAPALAHPNYLLYPTFSPHSDITVIHWPKAHLMGQYFSTTGSAPLWTPVNLSGMPLAANQLAMLFYPPAWLFLFLPPEPVFNLLFIFHLLWAGFGLFCLLRRGFGLNTGPALVGGLGFALNGKLLAHAAGGHVSMIGAAAWMPWALLGVTLLFRKEQKSNRLLWILLTAVALAMQVRTHTLITLYTGYLLAAYVIWEIVVPSRSAGTDPNHADRSPGSKTDPDPVPNSLIARIKYNLPGRNLILALLAIPALAIALGAAQLLPLVELAGYSNRALTLAESGQYALTPLTLGMGILLPSSRGGHEMVIYPGLVLLVLAVLGISRQDRRSWFFAGLSVLCAVYALGTVTPLFGLAYHWLPGFSWVRTPARVFFLAALAISILAGMGVQRIQQKRIPWSNLVGVAVAATTLALGVGIAFLLQPGRASLGLALLPGLTVLLVGLAVRNRLSSGLAVVGLTLLLWVDLATFDASMMRFVSPGQAFAEGEAAAAYLSGQPGLFRSYSPSYSLPAHTAARAGIQTADGVEPVHLASYDRFMEVAGGYGPLFEDQPGNFTVTVPRFPANQAFDQALKNIEPNPELLGLLNVEYILSAFPMEQEEFVPEVEISGTFVYRNIRSLPRAWIIPEPEYSQFLSPAGDADWTRQLEDLARLAAQSAASGQNVAEVVEYQADRILIDARSPKPSLLVLSENFYPGWQVRIDGHSAPVEHVAGLLRGALLDAGPHQVTIVYQPKSVAWGVRLSLMGWVLTAIAFGAWAWSRRRKGKV